LYHKTSLSRKSYKSNRSSSNSNSVHFFVSLRTELNIQRPIIIIIRGLVILFSITTTSNNSILFFIIYTKSQQLQGQLPKHHSVENIGVNQILMITLQRKKSIISTATRPFSKYHSGKNTCSAFNNKEKCKANNNKKY
jgi:hypothetical protein